jgi:hypothetical protein
VQAETELLKRDRILDAITKIAAGLLAAPHTRCRNAGRAPAGGRNHCRRSCVVVLRATRGPDGGFLVHQRGAWNAPGVEPRIHAGGPSGRPNAAAISGNFFATLAPGQIFAAFPRTMHSPLAEFLGV